MICKARILAVRLVRDVLKARNSQTPWSLVQTPVLLLTVSRSPLETIWADFALNQPQVHAKSTDLIVVVKEAGKTQTVQPQEGTFKRTTNR